MSKNITRNKILDIARGLAILFVCAYHIVYTPENDFAYRLSNESIWFAIPFFFLLSGYLYRVERYNLIYRVKALLIPSLVCTSLLLVIGGAYCMLFHSYTINDIFIDFVYTYLRPEFSAKLIPINMNYWDRLLYDVISPVWFIWTLILTLPVFYFFMRFTSHSFRNLFIICAVMLLISFMLYDYRNYFSWSLTLVPVYAAVMLAGDYCSGLKLYERLDNSGSYLIALIAFIIHTVMYYFSGSSRAFMNELGTIGKWSVFTFFIQVFIGSYAFILLCKLLGKIKYVSEFLQFTGRNSLFFMFLHRPLGVIFSDLLGTYIKSGPTWQVEVNAEVFIYSVIVFILSIISCSAFAFIIKNINGGSLSK